MKHLRLIVMATVILGITWSCQQDEDLSPQIKEQVFLSESDMNGMTKLGKQLENPYSVENMKKALKSLKASSSNGRTSGEEIEITTTHFYIKFKPKNEDELSVLKRDSTLILYDYPLDYEIEEVGDFYHDPAIPINQPTYQYCAAEINKELPDDIEYELLANLFIPDEEGDEDDESTSGRISSSDFIDALVDQSLVLTGNLAEEDASTSDYSNARRSKWRPAGRIQVWDDNFGRYVGIEGVEVRARRWFTTHEGIANSLGYYSCNGRFRRDANYSIKWERYQFLIRDKWLSPAKYDGPKKRGNWDLNIRNGAQEFYATIFRAAHHYYYKNIKGLRRPPQNGTFKTQMKIRAYNESNSDKNGSHKEERRFLGLGSQIKIWNPQNTSRSIYATTIHELAHASHWDLKRSDFDDSDKIVKESWARGVQWELTRTIYSGYVSSYSRLRYTGVVQDMIDGSKTTTSRYYFTDSNPWVSSTKIYSDAVSGYSIRQIEDALQGKKSWNSWRDNIKNKYNNGTKNNLDATFIHWNTK